MSLAFLSQDVEKIENAYQTLIKKLETCRVVALQSVFGDLKWINIMEEVWKLYENFLFELIVQL